MPRRRRAASLTAVAIDVGPVAALVQGDEHRLVLGLVVDHRLRDRDLHGRGQVEALAVAVDRVDDDAERPASPRRRSATSMCRTRHRHEGDRTSRCRPGPRTAAGRARRCAGCPARGRAARRPGTCWRNRITEMWAIVNDSIAPNAYMLPRNSAWPGISVRQAIAPNTMIPIHGRAELRVQLAQPVGHLAVDAHRVDQPRHADDPGVGGDEQDRRRQQADVDLGRALQRAQVQVLDHPQHRVAGEAALALGQAQQRLALAVHAV